MSQPTVSIHRAKEHDDFTFAVVVHRDSLKYYAKIGTKNDPKWQSQVEIVEKLVAEEKYDLDLGNHNMSIKVGDFTRWQLYPSSDGACVIQ